MHRLLRRSVFALPFGCLVAIATHFVRFGDDHAFGGEANEALVSGAVAGSILIAVAILHAFLTGGSTQTTGTLAAARLRELIPGGPTLFGLAATVYYGIELLEGNGIEFGLPTLLLAGLALLLAAVLRGVAARCARIVGDLLRDWFALLDRRERLVWRLARRPQPVHARITLTARRLGRAPPKRR